MGSEDVKATLRPIYGVDDSPLAKSMFDGFLDCNGSKEPKNPKGCHINWQEARKKGGLLKNLRDCTSDWAGGVLKEGISCVDIDDDDTFYLVLGILRAEQAEVLADKSDHGGHIYFADGGIIRTASTKYVCVCGIGYDAVKGLGQFDWRVGTKNYMVVRSKGKDRQIVYESPTGKLGPLPVWLDLRHPNEFKRVLKDLPIGHLEEGDGRNTKVFRYYAFLRLVLKFSAEDAREICRIINWYLFKDPMDDNEFESATREDRDWEQAKACFGSSRGAGNRASNNGGTNITLTADTTTDEIFDTFSQTEQKQKRWEKVVDYTILNHKIYNYNGTCAIYREKTGEAKILSRTLINAIVGEDFENRFKFNESELRISQINLQDYAVNTLAIAGRTLGVIPYADCNYWLKDGTWTEFSPDVLVPHRLSYNRPTCTEVPEFCMNTIMAWADYDEEVAKLLIEVMGFVYTGQLDSIQQCIVLLGPKQNGKSKFIDLLKYLAGEGGYTSVALDELSDKFLPAELVGKRLNACDEIDESSYISDTKKFRQLIGQGSIMVQRKNRDPLEFLYEGVMCFACNTMPRFKDDTGSVLRRLVLIPFTHTFEKNDQFGKDMMKPEFLEGFKYLAQKGARKLFNEGKGFTRPARCEPLYEEFKEASDPFGGFLDEVDVGTEIIGVYIGKVYDDYKFHAKDSGNGLMSKTTFGKKLREKLNLKVEQRRLDDGSGRTVNRKVYARV